MVLGTVQVTDPEWVENISDMTSSGVAYTTGQPSEGSCGDVEGTRNALDEDVTPSCDKNLRYIVWNVGCQDDISIGSENYDLIYVVTATIEAGSKSHDSR